MADDATTFPGTTSTPPEAIDINDQSLQVEQLNVNLDADQFAGLPTVPEGDYRAKIKLKNPDNRVDSLWVRVIGTRKNKDQSYTKTGIEARVDDPQSPYDGWPVFDNMITTLVQPLTGTNKIVGILKDALREPLTKDDLTNIALMRKLEAALAFEPTVRIHVVWEGYCQQCKDDKRNPTVRGEKRWPENGHGTHLNVMECSYDGTKITAQARIDRYSADV